MGKWTVKESDRDWANERTSGTLLFHTITVGPNPESFVERVRVHSPNVLNANEFVCVRVCTSEMTRPQRHDDDDEDDESNKTTTTMTATTVTSI